MDLGRGASFIYIYATPTPPETHSMIPPPKTLFRAVFVVDAKHPPVGPDFA